MLLQLALNPKLGQTSLKAPRKSGRENEVLWPVSGSNWEALAFTWGGLEVCVWGVGGLAVSRVSAKLFVEVGTFISHQALLTAVDW